MIKVKNNTATREPVPRFLIGLTPESLAELSWADPALGVQDCAWWPEEDQSPSLGEFERYGDETLTADLDRRVVIVVRDIEPWSEEEIAQYQRSLIPEKVTMRQARLALHNAGVLSLVQPALDALPEPPRTSAQIEWDHSSEVFRDKPFVNMLGAQLGLNPEQIDQLFLQAAQL
jgi:hypothetical protein